MFLRDIVEQPRFTYDFDLLRGKFPRMDEVHDAITWVLSRTPWVGETLPSFPDFRVFKTTSVANVPSFRVLYEVDENTVILHAISEE